MVQDMRSEENGVRRNHTRCQESSTAGPRAPYLAGDVSCVIAFASSMIPLKKSLNLNVELNVSFGGPSYPV